MMMSSPEDIKRRIIELEVEHRDLDAVIDTLIRDASGMKSYNCGA